MKKVSGWIEVRSLGTYNFEFYVEDDATEEEIQARFEEECGLSYDYSVES